MFRRIVPSSAVATGLAAMVAGSALPQPQQQQQQVRALHIPTQTNRNAQAHYRQDKTLNHIQVDIIHQLYQLCVRTPIPLSAIPDKLTSEALRDIKTYGSIESFVKFHHKYLRLENGLLHPTQNYRSSGSPQLIDELVKILRSVNNVPQRSIQLFGQLTGRARADFAITRMKSIADFAKLRPATFVVDEANGHVRLTKEVFEDTGSGVVQRVVPSPASLLRSGKTVNDHLLAEAMANASAATVGGGSHTKKDFVVDGVRVGPSADAPAPLDFLGMAWRCIPNAYFIPLVRAFTVMQDEDARVTAFGLDGFLLQLRQLPPRYVELVSFAGPSVPREEVPNHTYIRLVGGDIAMAGVETGDARNSEFEVVQRFTKDLVKYLQPHGEVKVSQIPGLLPPTLAAELPFKGSALMLIFDRMQHMFRVNKGAMTVQVTGDEGLATKDLTKVNTPMPVELRAALDLLAEQPLAPQQFERYLGDRIRENIANQFGSLPKFVNAHKIELFLKNGFLYTPAIASKEALVQGASSDDFRLSQHEQLLASGDGVARPGAVDEEIDYSDMEGAMGANSMASSGNRIIPSLPIPRMTPKQLAEYIYQCIPDDRCVSWMSLRGYVDLSVFQHAAFSAGDARDFFIARPDLFNTFDPAFMNGFIIGKAHLRQPHGTWEEVNDLLTVYKMIAMVTVGGISEAALVQLLPRDIRAIIKRCGGFEHLMAQVPTWFDVRNPSGLAGHSVVTYIAHLNPSIRQLPSEYVTKIPCIPEAHNIRFDRYKYTPIHGATNSDVNDPYAEYDGDEDDAV